MLLMEEALKIWVLGCGTEGGLFSSVFFITSPAKQRCYYMT